MARQSLEERSAAAWRAGDRHPVAPKTLSIRAKKVWREVVECRPPDYFRPGSLVLLGERGPAGGDGGSGP
jgi:hypothetical protein